MATRSAIGYMMPNGKVEAVYCHWDGQPNHQLPILEQFYNKLCKVKDLIKPGFMSSLRTSHMWGSMPIYEYGKMRTDEKGNIIYFPTRDPQPLYHYEQEGEKAESPIVSNNLEEAFKVWLDYGCEHLYVFNSRKGWSHFEL